MVDWRLLLYSGQTDSRRRDLLTVCCMMLVLNEPTKYLIAASCLVPNYTFILFRTSPWIYGHDCCSARHDYYWNLFELIVDFLWPPCIADADIIFCSCNYFLLLFSSPVLSGWRLDVYHTFTWCGLSANLECRSEMCCTRLSGSTGHKNDVKNCHLGTIVQICWAISSQLRHVSTIGKKSCETAISAPHVLTIWRTSAD